MIYSSRVEHTNHYTTDVVIFNGIYNEKNKVVNNVYILTLI